MTALASRSARATALPADVVQTIIALAHTLGLEVTAEGIEYAEQAVFLQTLGCTRGQGYLYARPCSAASFDFSPPAALRRAA